MKTFILTITAFLFSLGAFSQNEFMMGLTVNKYNVNTLEASGMGYGLIMSFNNIYIDFSSNFASGEGEYLEFASSRTYKLNKLSTLAFNFGYIANYKSVALIPFIGYGSIGEIYQDPIGWDTYYIVRKSRFNAGLIGRVLVSDKIAFQAGYGIFEGIKFGISYNILY